MSPHSITSNQTEYTPVSLNSTSAKPHDTTQCSNHEDLEHIILPVNWPRSPTCKAANLPKFEQPNSSCQTWLKLPKHGTKCRTSIYCNCKDSPGQLKLSHVICVSNKRNDRQEITHRTMSELQALQHASRSQYLSYSYRRFIINAVSRKNWSDIRTFTLSWLSTMRTKWCKRQAPAPIRAPTAKIPFRNSSK
jgi:hypothetical protein